MMNTPDILIQNNLIHLQNDFISYVMEIHDGQLFHAYFGRRIAQWKTCSQPLPYKRSFTVIQEGFSRPDDELPYEFPQAGRGDFRNPAIILSQMNTGNTDKRGYFDFRFRQARIIDRLIGPDDMPGIGKEGKTLVVEMADAASSLVLELYYGICADFSGIFRFQKLTCRQQGVIIRNLVSFSLEVQPGRWTVLSLAGTHLKEGTVQKTVLPNGKMVLESTRGVSSSQHPPYFALLDEKAGWGHGEIISGALIYSGSHAEIFEKDYFGQLRIQGGIHPDFLEWPLEPGESFCTPQAILGWDDRGLNGMAQNFHGLFSRRLFASRPFLLLLNSWESVYYQTTQSNLESLAGQAAAAGMDLLVVDDGWFRQENNSRCGIGDWTVNPEKLPEGLDGVARVLKNQNLEMGLWFEPEAVSKNSRLAAAHPEWILSMPGFEPAEGRHEWLLDLSQPAVQDHIIKMLDSYLSAGKISYIKWDMNRPLADLPDGKSAHGYVLGLYRILEEITRKYPRLMIEGCSSGGSRLDPAILHYACQNWASDNTDPFDRVKIQSGLSLFLPPSHLTAHISASPNHQTGRCSRMEDQYQTARFFNPGFELNLSLLSNKQLEEVRRISSQIRKEHEQLESAQFYQQDRAWIKMDPQKRWAEVLVFQEHFEPADALLPVRISGLAKEQMYEIRPLGLVMSGAQLQYSGFRIPLADHDFAIQAFSIRQADDAGPQENEGI